MPRTPFNWLRLQYATTSIAWESELSMDFSGQQLEVVSKIQCIFEELGTGQGNHKTFIFGIRKQIKRN